MKYCSYIGLDRGSHRVVRNNSPLYSPVPLVPVRPVSAEPEALKPLPGEPAGMSQATKIVIGTTAVAGGLALALVVTAVL